MASIIKSIDISKLQQATIFVLSTGQVEQINAAFTALLGWKPEDILKQNISLLVSPKMVRKSTHDDFLKKYHLNKDSRIVGQARVLPVKNADDEEQFITLQIIPIGTAKSFCFLCFFSPVVEVTNIVPDEDLVQSLTSRFARMQAKEDNFRQNTPENTEIVSLASTFLEKEIIILTKFVMDNAHLEETWKLLKYLLYKKRLGKLSLLYDLLVKYSAAFAVIVYTNIICLRILFPSFMCSDNAALKERTKAFSKEIFNEVDTLSSTFSGSFRV